VLIAEPLYFFGDFVRPSYTLARDDLFAGNRSVATGTTYIVSLARRSHNHGRNDLFAGNEQGDFRPDWNKSLRLLITE